MTTPAKQSYLKKQNKEKKMKKLVSIVLLLAIVMSFCVMSVSAQDNVFSGDKSEEYYMITFLSGIDY